MLRKRVLFALLLPGILTLSVLAAKSMKVQIKKADIRESPMQLSKVLGSVDYDKEVSVLEEKGAWMRVSTPDSQITGWMHASALSAKTIWKSGGKEAPSSVSSSEMGTGNKGFDANVEADFKKSQNLDYSWVDKMESFMVPDEAVKDFMDKGGLRSGKGESK
ncbi:MAG: SH3 domain-containing protein [Candidatus Sumerlaeota bacterium]|nr:SH3 domain-containing protein [Candidatus Sumerlaeota bacterium]